MCDKDIDGLAGEIMCVKEGVHGHGKISPPVGEGQIDRAVVGRIDHILGQSRACALVLLLLGLVDGLIVIGRVGLFGDDLHDVTAGLFRDPVRDHACVALQQAVAVHTDAGTGIRIDSFIEIRVADAAEIQDDSIFIRDDLLILFIRSGQRRVCRSFIIQCCRINC